MIPTSDDDRRRRGVDLRAGLGQAGERQVGGIAGAIRDGRRVEIDRRRGQAGGVLPGADRVAEGQRVGAGAAGVGRGAAVVEGQRRRAAATVTASLRLSVSVTVLPASRSPLDGDSTTDDDRRRRGVDLRAGLGQAGQRQVGGIAGAVGDGRRR